MWFLRPCFGHGYMRGVSRLKYSLLFLVPACLLVLGCASQTKRYQSSLPEKASVTEEGKKTLVLLGDILMGETDSASQGTFNLDFSCIATDKAITASEKNLLSKGYTITNKGYIIQDFRLRTGWNPDEPDSLPPLLAVSENLSPDLTEALKAVSIFRSSSKLSGWDSKDPVTPKLEEAQHFQGHGDYLMLIWGTGMASQKGPAGQAAGRMALGATLVGLSALIGAPTMAITKAPNIYPGIIHTALFDISDGHILYYGESRSSGSALTDELISSMVNKSLAKIPKGARKG